MTRTTPESGIAYISLSNVGRSQLVKFQTTVNASGTPVSVSLNARSLPQELGALAPARRISMTINSVPQGAALKIDGVDSGTTPRVAQLPLGKHILRFSKDGFNPWTFPLEIGFDAASVGSVSY